MDNYYDILQCSKTATLQEIKKQYLNLVKQYHPDKGSETYDKFLLLDKAYKTLKDEQSRKDYDALLFLNTCSDDPLIYAQLNKKDIVFNSDGLFMCTCRCGSKITIVEDFVEEEEECSFECSECSNCILIK